MVTALHAPVPFWQFNRAENGEVVVRIVEDSESADQPCALAQVAADAAQARARPADFPVMGADHRLQRRQRELKQQLQASQKRQRQHEWICCASVGQADQNVLAGDAAEFPKRHQGVLVRHVLQHLKGTGQVKRLIGYGKIQGARQDIGRYIAGQIHRCMVDAHVLTEQLHQPIANSNLQHMYGF